MNLYRPFLLFSMIQITLLAALPVSAGADEIVRTYPPGSAKDVLEKGDKDSKDIVGRAGGALIVDDECAKKFPDGKKSMGQKPTNARYEKCIKEQLESAKKSGHH